MMSPFLRFTLLGTAALATLLGAHRHAAPRVTIDTGTLEGVADGFHERVRRMPAAIEDRAATDLDDVAERKHRDSRRFRGSHHVPVEQALSHQPGPQVMPAVGPGIARH